MPNHEIEHNNNNNGEGSSPNSPNAHFSMAGNFTADDLHELLGAISDDHHQHHPHHLSSEESGVCSSAVAASFDGATVQDNPSTGVPRAAIKEKSKEGSKTSKIPPPGAASCFAVMATSNSGTVDNKDGNRRNDDVVMDDSKAQARSERKRCREKQRRSDVNKQFADLTQVLREIEGSTEETSRLSFNPANRVDLIARSIVHLERFRDSHRRQKHEIESLRQQLDQARKAGEDTAAKLKEVMFNQPSQSQPPKQVMMMVPMMMPADGSGNPFAAAGANGGGMAAMLPGAMNSMMTGGMNPTMMMPQPFIGGTGAPAPTPNGMQPRQTQAPQQALMPQRGAQQMQQPASQQQQQHQTTPAVGNQTSSQIFSFPTSLAAAPAGVAAAAQPAMISMPHQGAAMAQMALQMMQQQQQQQYSNNQHAAPGTPTMPIAIQPSAPVATGMQQQHSGTNNAAHHPTPHHSQAYVGAATATTLPGGGVVQPMHHQTTTMPSQRATTTPNGSGGGGGGAAAEDASATSNEQKSPDGNSANTNYAHCA